MSKRTMYTIITPLPKTITRQTAVETLHDHSEMIDLNPLVIRHENCRAPPHAPPDEFHAKWYNLTDRISYFPGIKGKVHYKACFHDLPRGLQTHVYAPASLQIKEKWTIGGNMPGEPREVLELGLVGVPREGLYLREDVDMTCNIFLMSFVKKTLKKAHAVLVDRLVVKADLDEERRVSHPVAPEQPVSPEIPDLHQPWTPSTRSNSVFIRKDSTHASKVPKNHRKKPDVPALNTSRNFITPELKSWQDRSPTVATSSRSGSSKSTSQGLTSWEKKQRRRMSLQSNMFGSMQQYTASRERNSSTASDDSVYSNPPPQGTFAYELPGYANSMGNLKPVELPADESTLPNYMRQQSMHEDAIRGLLEQPNATGKWPPRRDSSMYSERSNSLRSQSVHTRVRSNRFELEA